MSFRPEVDGACVVFYDQRGYIEVRMVSASEAEARALKDALQQFVQRVECTEI